MFKYIKSFYQKIFKILKYTAQTLVDEKWEILTEEERRFIEKFKKKKKKKKKIFF